MEVYKSDAYPIVFQPYTLTIHVTTEEDDDKLKCIFLNSHVVAKALTAQGFDDKAILETFIDQIGKYLQD